jgi:hypothetical protein
MPLNRAINGCYCNAAMQHLHGGLWVNLLLTKGKLSPPGKNRRSQRLALS